MTPAISPLKRSALSLEVRAELLWPDSPVNQAKWVAAVTLVRGTKRGWVADSPTGQGPAATRCTFFGAAS